MKIICVVVAVVSGLFVLAAIGSAGIAGAIHGGAILPSEEALADIPGVALAAYGAAAERCDDVPWTVLAAIGKVETNHGRHGGSVLTATGDTVPPILGVVLDGSTPGTRPIPLPAGGSPYHSHPTHDRAVGPMQFLTATFQSVGVDGNADGTVDPQNIWDAANSAANYLCPDRKAGSLEQAIRRYNNSAEYVAEVLEWADTYTSAETPAPAGPATGNIVEAVNGIQVDASIAVNVRGLAAAASADGWTLDGGGYRSADEQVALRRAHCGTSNYAIYEMPASQCSPPTARPGRSNHERGLAIDFRCNGSLISSRNACWSWLNSNAARFGLENLPSEPWHWSVDGN